MREYNYAALNSAATTQAVGGPKRLTDPVKPMGVAIIAFIIVSILATVMIIFGVASGMGIGGILSAVVFGFFNQFLFFVVIIVGVVFFVRLQKSNRERIARITSFAAANGLVYKRDVPPDGMKGLIFDNGHSRSVTEVLSFPDGMELGTYRFVTGSGKNQRTHVFGYARVALNRHLPNMVLDSRSNNFLNMTNLPDIFNASQRLSLEGDFDTHFSLYAPKQYERDALYVFTPDVMSLLIEKGTKYDMEIVDDELYLYYPVGLDIGSETKLKDIFATVDAISNELRSQTRRYTDERRDMADGTGHYIAQGGQRLKKGVNWVVAAIATGIIVLNVTMVFLPMETSLALNLIVGFLVWGFIVTWIVISLRRRA